MSYSIRDYVKINCTNKYTLSALNHIATNIYEDSGGKYTTISALKILCRYAYVKNNQIMFNADSRDSDQTYDQIKGMVEKNTGQIVSNKEETISSQRKTSDEPTKQIVKKKGFGSMSTIKHIVENNIDDGAPKKSKVKLPDTQIIKHTNITKKNNSDNESVTSKCSSGRKSITSTSKGMNLFATIGNINRKDNTQPPDNKQPTTTKQRGGFGVFSKSMINSKHDDNVKPRAQNKWNNEAVSKSCQLTTGSVYKIPVEGKYKGVLRTDKKYGPYGTDNYHSNNTQDDQISDDILRRTRVYRELASRYYPAQRSKEWFEMRDKMITASDGGTIVGVNPYEQPFSFITKKVFGKPFETNIDCYHGKKYEQVATSIYEYRMNVKVKEFGLCQHPKYSFLGASPDGIVSEYKLKTKDGRTWDEIDAEAILIDKIEDKHEFIEHHCIKTKFVGRMLEIKCPFRRKILMDDNIVEVYGVHGEKITDLKKDCKKGICPSYYWVQVQLQLQCCDLDECDFWQCEVNEYADKDDFLDDTDPEHPWLSRQHGHEKGAVIQLMPIDQINNPGMKYLDRIYNFASFIYQPRIDMTPVEIDTWINKTLHNLNKTHTGMVFDSIKYWKVIASRNITINKDDKWFADNLDMFRKLWDYVEYFRANKDKGKLLKRYINTFPLDYYKKIKEPVHDKGIIMKNLHKLFSEPHKDAPSKDHKTYAKFIAKLNDDIKKSGIVDPKEYDVNNDIVHIKRVLDMVPPDNMSEGDRNDHIKKFTEFVKFLKIHVDHYIYGDVTNIYADE